MGRSKKIQQTNNGRIGMRCIKPKTKNQAKYYQTIENKKICLVVGKAGTGKSCLAVQYAVQELIKKNYERIILTRPYIGAENGMGHLPGNIEEKMNPYMKPLYDEMINYGLSCEEIKKKIADGVIEIVPILYARGRSFHNSVIILDETQNCTYEQLLLMMTRFGRKSKMIITADPTQSDICKDKQIDFYKISKLLFSIEDFGFVELDNEDIVREVIVGEILEKLEGYK